jgi:hypothetical protein
VLEGAYVADAIAAELAGAAPPPPPRMAAICFFDTGATGSFLYCDFGGHRPGRLRVHARDAVLPPGQAAVRQRVVHQHAHRPRPLSAGRRTRLLRGARAEDAAEHARARLTRVARAALHGRHAPHDLRDVLAASGPGGLSAGPALHGTAHEDSPSTVIVSWTGINGLRR